MKKPIFHIYLILTMSLSIAITSHIRAQTAQQTYFLGPQVFGSGGVMGATGVNSLHSATAGQIVTESIQGSNNLLLSGFWYFQPFISTGLETSEDALLPTLFELRQNYPNPFNPQTTIEYDLPQSGQVTVAIFNVMGQQIRLLVNDKKQGPGTVKVVWNGQDDQGRIVNSGLYLYRVEASTTGSTNILFQDIKKMLVVK